MVLRMSTPVALAVLTEANESGPYAVSRALMRIGVDDAPYSLFHTRMGQPRLRRKRGFAPSGASHPVVSFSDEGSLRMAAVARSEAVAGLGLDILDTRRLDRCRTDSAARRRMERRLCHPDEISDMCAHHDLHPCDVLALRFALKEAVSKALGTGLRLGLGLGAKHGLSPQDIRVVPTARGADIRVVGRAAGRIAYLGASTIETHIEHSGSLLIAVALLLR